VCTACRSEETPELLGGDDLHTALGSGPLGLVGDFPIWVSGRSRSKTYGKGYDSFVMRHRSDFPKKGSLRESCGAEQRIFKELRVIFFRLETLFSGKSSRRTLAGSLPLSHKSFLVRNSGMKQRVEPAVEIR
jgi:hypothetical protein